MEVLPLRQGEKETMDSPYNTKLKNELYLKLKCESRTRYN